MLEMNVSFENYYHYLPTYVDFSATMSAANTTANQVISLIGGVELVKDQTKWQTTLNICIAFFINTAACHLGWHCYWSLFAVELHGLTECVGADGVRKVFFQRLLTPTVLYRIVSISI